MGSLFRSEVIEAQRRRLWGDVRLSQPPSFAAWTALLVLISGSIFLFLAFGTYVRKETVQGYIAPKGGVVQIYGDTPGKITKVMVQEGSHVTAGQGVVMVSGERAGVATGAVIQAQILQLDHQIESAKLKLESAKLALGSDDKRLQDQLDAQISMRSVLQRRLADQQSIIDITKEQLAKYEQLSAQGYVSKVAVSQLRQQILAQQGTLNDVEQQLSSNNANIEDLKTQLRALPARIVDANAAGELELSQLEQQRIQLSASQNYIERATVSGTVSSLQISVGQTIRGNVPLVSIVPDGVELEAELLFPSRAVGFIKEGNEARLQIAAFPFTKYGFVMGRILAISKSVLQPSEIDSGVSVTEPVYRVRVALDRPYIVAYGEKKSLEPGMSLLADVVVDRRPIWQQLFDPLLATAKRSQ